MRPAATAETHRGGRESETKLVGLPGDQINKSLTTRFGASPYAAIATGVAAKVIVSPAMCFRGQLSGSRGRESRYAADRQFAPGWVPRPPGSPERDGVQQGPMKRAKIAPAHGTLGPVRAECAPAPRRCRPRSARCRLRSARARPASAGRAHLTATTVAVAALRRAASRTSSPVTASQGSTGACEPSRRARSSSL